MHVLYNCYFTWEFVRLLVQIYRPTSAHLGDDVYAVQVTPYLGPCLGPYLGPYLGP